MAFIRFIGTVCLLAIFVTLGYDHAIKAETLGKYIAAGNLQFLVDSAAALASVKTYKISADEYTLAAYITAGNFLVSSLFIILGVAKRFFALLLVIDLAIITVCQHVNVKNVAATPEAEIIHILKNISIIGGLLQIVGAAQPKKAVAAANAAPAKATKAKTH